MTEKRQIELFSAGCPVCENAVAMVQQCAGSSREVTVLDMHDADIASRAGSLGIRSLPAMVIDGELADCCQGRGIDQEVLRRAGLGPSTP